MQLSAPAALGGRLVEDRPTYDVESRLGLANKRLEELHRAAQSYVGPLELPGPDEKEMEQVRECIRREGEPWR